MKKEIPRDEFIRKRMERQRRIRKRRLIIFFIFLMITAFCVGITLSLTVFFPIEKIVTGGSEIYTSGDILKYSQVEKGDNLFTVSRNNVEKALKKNLPYIEEVKIKRELPGTLKITVTDAEEFACYSIGERFFIVSKSGWVLKENDKVPDNIINIKASDIKCEVGGGISFKDETAKELVDRIIGALEKEKIIINTVDVTDPLSINIFVDNRFEVALGTDENIERKILHLSGMIKNIAPEKSGKINLSMWTSTNTQGTFTEKKDK